MAGLTQGLALKRKSIACAFAPALMERTIAGVTLAIMSGFGLIIAAFVLALVYGWLCRLPAEDSQGKETPR
jgi:uncharacterized membrane protein (DUF485 family)